MINATNMPPRAGRDPERLARWEAQHRESIRWHRAAGLCDRVVIGCPYDPTRPEPDNRVYTAALNGAGELIYTLEDADAFEADCLAALRRRDAQRAAQRDAR